MEVITASMLDSLSDEKKREFEGILPLLVKKLITNSCKLISSIRMPDGNDIWAPGFDGLVHCDEQTTYVAAGDSVWEFGANKDSFKKVNEDYRKRTSNTLGLKREETSFYFVTPKIWAYSKTITEWEAEHTEWKQARVYDASVLCDWINSEPAVCAWLMEKLFNASVDFVTLEYAWNKFTNKTSPCFTPSLFLTDREKEICQFTACLQSSVVRIKADSYIEAVGFVLSALMKDPIYKATSIVVNNEATYRTMVCAVNSKTIILNYPCNHDIDVGDRNRIILCFGKEDISIKADIELDPLPKHHYICAFKDMGVSNAGELYSFTHGNIRALIRRIPGSTNESKPEWAQREKKDLLAPLLFLRKFSRRLTMDRQLVETLADVAFDEIEREYQDLIRMEDSPIKEVDEYYVLVNYEETWNTLQYTINSLQYVRLTTTIIALLDDEVKDGLAGETSDSSDGRSVSLQNLFTNYIYFSFDDPNSQLLKQSIQGFLDYFYKKNSSTIIMHHMSVLAEAAPDIVARFLSADIKNEDSYLFALFDSKEYDDRYTYILFCIEELTRHAESVVRACELLFRLYQKDYHYKSANSPEDSLTTALCIINTSVPLTPKQKAELLLKFLKKDPDHGSRLILQILGRDSFIMPSKYGKRDHLDQTSMSYSDYFDTNEKIAKPCLPFFVNGRDVESVILLINQYRKFRPEFMAQLASLFSPEAYEIESLVKINYHVRKMKYDMQRRNSDLDKAYIGAFDMWVNRTDVNDIPFRWLFFKYYGCPDDRLLSFEGDYQQREAESVKLRKEVIDNVITRIGLPGLFKLMVHMDDSYAWGWFLANNTEKKCHLAIAEKALEYGKIKIVAGILDHSSKEVFTAIYQRIPEDIREKLFISMCRTDADDWLETEAEKNQYWSGKTMYKYNDHTYSKLLKYYPAGLLYYCYETIKHSPVEHLDLVVSIISAIRALSQRGEIPSNMQEYEFKEIMEAIDRVLYTEEWGKLCMDIFVEGIVSEPSEAATKYFFYHPLDLIGFIENSRENHLKAAWHYHLPNCAYEDQVSLKRFAESLVKSDHLSLLGSILGRSVCGKDGIFPHESIRDLLELLDDEEVDRNVYIGFLNSRGARLVTDGSDQKQLGNQFLEASRSMEITYQHTAAVLRYIADDYMREARYDHLHAELDP